MHWTYPYACSQLFIWSIHRACIFMAYILSRLNKTNWKVYLARPFEGFCLCFSWHIFCSYFMTLCANPITMQIKSFKICCFCLPIKMGCLEITLIYLLIRTDIIFVAIEIWSLILSVLCLPQPVYGNTNSITI